VFRSALVNRIECKANNGDGGNAEDQNDRDESGDVFRVEFTKPTPKVAGIS